MSTLRENFDFYKAHQAELMAKYAGKFLVIHDLKVIDAFDSAQAAVAEASKTMPMGTFLVQEVVPGEGTRPQTFHSRVRFA